MDIIFEVNMSGKNKGSNVSFAIGFTCNPKELFDNDIDPRDFTKKLLNEAEDRLVEHLQFLVNGQVSALDATRQT